MMHYMGNTLLKQSLSGRSSFYGGVNSKSEVVTDVRISGVISVKAQKREYSFLCSSAVYTI